MDSSPANPNATDWIASLAEFLVREDHVEAVRVDPVRRKVSVATLGSVDMGALRDRLETVLAGLEKEHLLDTRPPEAPATLGFGVHYQSGDRGALLEKPTCPTAPHLWQWREFAWPEPEELERQSREEWKALALQAAICGVALVVATVLEKFGAVPSWLVRSLFGVSLLAGGWDAAGDAWEKIRLRQLDVHFLMLAVAAGAVSIGAWTEGALLLFLFSLSGALEHYALHRTHREINALTKAAPKTARVLLPDGRIEERPVNRLGAGDLLQLKPDEAFAADGEVVSGESAADESNLTGEAKPVPKAAGDSVYGGTLNLWGALTVKVTRAAAESSLQKIVRLIREAQHLRAPSQRFTDRFGTQYTALILGATVAMFFVWWLGFGLAPFRSGSEAPSAFYRSMMLLVVASPCALVLSIPSAILAAIASGARRGVLFRGGAAVENLDIIDTVALDKTGTLTTGELRVGRIESFPPGGRRRCCPSR